MRKLEITDSELLSQFRQGNEEAFHILHERHYGKIFAVVYCIVKDYNFSEDLVQEVFMKVVCTIRNGRYNEEGKFLPWVMRIAHNLAIDYFRKNRRYPTIIMEDGANVFNKLEFSEKSREDEQVEKDTIDLLVNYIDELPVAQQDVLMMRHYLKMSFHEIAKETNVSINTALGRMRYALINLRKKLTPQKVV